MGACEVIEYSEGKNAREAFDNARDRFVRERGEDMYNGTISTCSLRDIYHKFDIYKDTPKRCMEIDRLIEEILDECPKWNCDYIDLGVKYYKKITFKKEKVIDEYDI